MEGHLVMSVKERRRKSVFDEVQEGRLTLGKAAQKLSLSYRQCCRSYRRFREEGDAGLVHRSRGRPSNRRLCSKLRNRVVKRYEERYKGFGPTLASEKLAEEGLVVDHETLRRLLLERGLWTRQRRHGKHRGQRERKAHFGELVQLDGSHHAWFGVERARSCLMNLVDDAQGTTLGLMAAEETTEAAMRALWAWVERYGIPQALYVDRKNVYVTGREPTVEEQLADVEPLTAFGMACAKLDIEIVVAHSPQAKGRVERSHGVYQDRFVKELALRGITTIETANRLLQNGFVDKLNARFTQSPVSSVDFHRPVPKGMDLADVFCFEEFRTVQNDWTIRYKNRHYQILEENRPLPKPKDRVVVRKRLDGSLHVLFRDRPLKFQVLPAREVRRRTDAQERAEPSPQPVRRPFASPKPAPDHPWRRFHLQAAREKETP
jgi:transposase